MQKIFLLLTLGLLAGTVYAQDTPDAFYPAKYQVYKIVLKSNKATHGRDFREVKSWNVNELLVTKKETLPKSPQFPRHVALIYNAVGEYYLRPVGAPTYCVYLANYKNRLQLNDGIVEETYDGIYELGQIIPPAVDVSFPSQMITTIIWRTAVSGNKSLNVEWNLDEEKQNPKINPHLTFEQALRETQVGKLKYRLTFYCRPVQM